MSQLESREHNLSSAAFFADNMGSDLNNLRYKPFYELSDDSFLIKDPVWGDEYIGDEPYDRVLIQLAHSDPLRRLQTIEQLTLPNRYSTIPGTANFSRWEHMWGSTILVRRLTQELNIDAKQSMYLQLKILLSDIKHTSFSHAGDWMFQGEGGSENEHEKRVDYTEVVGINRLLELNGFDPRIVFDDETVDITNTPQPGLDADRVDYTLRESYRWVDQTPLYKEFLNKDSFTMKDGRLVAKDIHAAQVMATSYLMLVKEHWQHPVHRLQLNLLLESLRRVFVASSGKATEWGSYSPRDLMTTADHTFMEKFREHDQYLHIIDRLMVDLGRSEKKLQWIHRRNLSRYVIERAVGEKSEKVDWITNYYKALPTACEIVAKDSGEDLRQNSRMVVIPLPALRARVIDPPYITDKGDIEHLSRGDPKLWEYIQGKLAITRKDYKAGIVQNRDKTARLKECITMNSTEWPSVMQRPRLPSGAVRSLLRKTVDTSIVEASDFIGLKVTK